MLSSANLDHGAALEAAARAEYERTHEGAWADVDAWKRGALISVLRDAVTAAAPYYAAQGWATGYWDGNDDSRIVGSDYYENPWGDYVQDEE